MATRTTPRAGVAQALHLSRDEVDLTLRHCWTNWPECALASADVPDADRLRAWIATARHDEREVVLRSLVNMASVRGDDDDDAARIVAWLMLGPACVLARKYRFVPDIDHHVAANLWLEIKQYDGRQAREVWSNLASRLRNRLFEEHATRCHEQLVPPGTEEEEYEIHPVRGREPVADNEEEVMAVLDSGVERGAISTEEQLLLLDVVAASASVCSKEKGGSLLSDAVSDLVGLSRGVSGRTVRRRVRSSITRLADCHRTWRRSA